MRRPFLVCKPPLLVEECKSLLTPALLLVVVHRRDQQDNCWLCLLCTPEPPHLLLLASHAVPPRGTPRHKCPETQAVAGALPTPASHCRRDQQHMHWPFLVCKPHLLVEQCKSPLTPALLLVVVHRRDQQDNCWLCPLCTPEPPHLLLLIPPRGKP